ncbi:MAG TPA: NUDIX domain-containing protein [Candidatus Dormibacteraeota bacterium]|jgi:predicted NUDIX family phosphoesterase|nr:NUDIX domain-containing protein [Candidatus Dormibacteraeota bacterium]
MGGEEQVLCLRRSELFAAGEWQGLRDGDVQEPLRAIRERSFFMPRAAVEEDPSYQQVIPYVVFGHAGRYLLTRRLRASSEARLHRRYSLGVGGHINPGDAGGGDPLERGLRREWEEEVAYRGRFEARFLGLLKEESSPVGRVHVGVVFLVEGDTDEIAIREPHKLAGELLTLAGMRPRYPDMESWSQVIYRYLSAAGAGPTAGANRS